MRALLVDIGNSRIKWAWLTDGRLGKAQAADYSGWRARDFATRVIDSRLGIDRILMASVAADDVSDALAAGARLAGAPVPDSVTARRSACGVTIAYIEPWRLGVDRLLAMIAARRRFPRRPVCVVAIGTAMTIDLLRADGRHAGGAIIPAPPLMVSSLLDGTSGIRRRAQGGASGRGRALFGRSTRAAVEQGSRFAAAAAVDRAISEARELVGRVPQLVLTGGGAAGVRPLIRSKSLVVPHLVLEGLAAWCADG
ncbi:MAG TPA: type III pantothenate kinase [Steroidobacteraceae bacterium]|nr:type III pantothenate kinase [Steroidobacteraceae bacterium]